MPHFCTCAANAAKCEVRGLETPELGKGWAPKQHVFNFGMLPKLGFSKETSKAISLINSIFPVFSHRLAQTFLVFFASRLLIKHETFMK